jgi:hypothetical protein
MSRLVALLVTVALVALAICSPALGAADAAPLRILFVGNSYTYENNLPFVFEALVRPVRDVKVIMMAAGGATLRRHVDGGTLLKQIADRQFDVVVLQEQSTLGLPRLRDGMKLIADPAAFHQAVREIAAAARAGEARVVMFATWPRAETPRSLAPLRNANVTIAKEVGAAVAPVGLVWDRLGGNTSEMLNLYGVDGLHPAGEGTYVAAAVLAQAILGKLPPLQPVLKVPLMDGRARLGGAFADIAPSAAAVAAIEDAVASVYRAAPREQFAEIPVPPAVPEPSMPRAALWGRVTPSFLLGKWRGDFACFGLDERAHVTLDLRADHATVQMLHATQNWPGGDDATVKWPAPDSNGVIPLSYPSKGKECTVEMKLVRVGNQLRDVVRFALPTDPQWVISTISLTRK